MTIENITLDGKQRVVMDPEDYADLVDARDLALAMQAVDNGTMPTIPDSAVDAYLAAATPLAFWRKRSARTQVDLAAACGISQPFLAQLEHGEREPSVGVLTRLAEALGVRLGDLVR